MQTQSTTNDKSLTQDGDSSVNNTACSPRSTDKNENDSINRKHVSRPVYTRSISTYIPLTTTSAAAAAAAASAAASAARASPLQQNPYNPKLPPLIPPFRFCMIEQGIYRGAYPSLKNLRFIKRLKLNTIISLISLDKNETTTDLTEFCEYENIKHIVHNVSKYDDDKFSHTPQLTSTLLSLLINIQFHPLYIHCRDGAHNTGIVIMCLRKLQNWTESCIYDEFIRYTKSNDISFKEKQFVESFNSVISVPLVVPNWLWNGDRFKKHPTIKLKLLFGPSAQLQQQQQTDGGASMSNSGLGGNSNTSPNQSSNNFLLIDNTSSSSMHNTPYNSFSKDLNELSNTNYNSSLSLQNQQKYCQQQPASTSKSHLVMSSKIVRLSSYLNTDLGCDVSSENGRAMATLTCMRYKVFEVRYSTQLAALDVHGICFLKP